MELSKSDKKIARILMDKAIQKEYENCNASVLAILTEGKDKKKDAGETYGQVYETVKKNDRYIPLNYDGITGAHFFTTVLNIYCKDLITDEDIDQFSETVSQRLRFLKNNNT